MPTLNAPDRARSVAAEPRATNLQVWSAMADMVDACA